jgi:hypothetical protein
VKVAVLHEVDVVGTMKMSMMRIMAMNMMKMKIRV